MAGQAVLGVDAVFEHEVPAREVRQHRDNPKTFLEGCRALHRMFCKVGREAPHLRERIPTRFADIEEPVLGILATVGDKGVRSEAWKAAAMAGAFTGDQEEIPPYAGHDWLETLEDWRSRQGTNHAVRSQEVVESDNGELSEHRSALPSSRPVRSSAVAEEARKRRRKRFKPCTS